MIEYWTTALVFCTAVIFLEIFPIYIILSVSLFAYLASLVFSQKVLILPLVLSGLAINLIYIGFQRFILTQKFKVKRNVLTLNSRENNISRAFNLRLINLDGSVTQQLHLLEGGDYEIIPMFKWGTKIRLISSFSQFNKFEMELAIKLNKLSNQSPWITFLGSNDFDHVTLTLLRQIQTRFNLLFFDQHSDWDAFFLTDIMCGSWLYEAFKTTNMLKVFHVGGTEKAFDASGSFLDNIECCANGIGMQKYIDDGQVICLPATRSFRKNPYLNYQQTVNQPIKISSSVFQDRLFLLLAKYHDELAQFPLFIAIDKDVLNAQENRQIWGAGELSIEDIETVISTFMQLCNYQIAGVSICGDYSPSKYNSLLHWGHLIEKIAFCHGVRTKITQSSLNLNECANKKLVSLLQFHYGESR
jgi:hypothetical protein